MACPKCCESKFFTEFYKGDKTCKECRKERVRENRREKAEYYQEYDRQRYRKEKAEQSETFFKKYRKKQTPEERADIQRRWRDSNREKVNAQARVQTAVKNGTLDRPTCCDVCLIDCKPEAHHSDYRKPLEVHWLCTSCHGRVHSALNYVRRYFGVEAHHILPEVIYGT